ncbi:hypothetical protein [Catellatospora sichuanensis]|uniref:hypothetical protein n=1 Tax=Catellatospora sichuanensis TaxID=1969805 RepID=UPI00164293A6|nr:hypothetical protein [Catellatospora sichuanensis]
MGHSAMISEPISRRRTPTLLGLSGMVIAGGGVGWTSCTAGEAGSGGALAQAPLLTSRNGFLGSAVFVVR